MKREYFFVDGRNDISREALAEQRKKMLRSLLLALTLIVGENLPVDTHPKVELPTAGLRRSEGLPKNFLSDKAQKEIAQHVFSSGRSDD